MLIFVLTALCSAASAASADEGIPLDPPVPVDGSPWSAQLTAWALPPQSTDYLVEEVERLACPLRFTVQPDGSATVDGSACPDSMRPAALEAAALWSFQPVEPTDQAATLRASFVVRYSAALGAMTLFTELDPGAAHPFEEGRPGLKLVLAATPAKPLAFKLKGKQKKAGAEPGSCTLRARIAMDGRVTETLVERCAPELARDAEARVRKARFSPGRIDGQVVEDVTDVVVTYR